MKTILRCAGGRARRGSAILTVTVVLVVVLVLLAGLLQFVGAARSAHVQQRDDLCALYVAEAGLGESYLALEQEPDPTERVGVATRGSAGEPLSFGNVEYWVEAEDLGTRVYALRGTSQDRLAAERIELIVREIPDGFFRYAVFGNNGVSMAPESFVDSYDSGLGSYADQYDGSLGFATEFGHVGSNEDIELRTNSEIHGNANPGPDHEVLELGPNTYVSGSTEPAETLVPLPPIVVPDIPSSGAQSVRGGSTLALGPGEVHLTSLTVASGGTVELRGPVTLVVDDLLMSGNTVLSMNTNGGPVEIYGTGDFELRSNSQLITNSTRPQDSALFLSSNNVDGTPRHRVDLSANADYIGLIYAPNARIDIATMFQIYGSVMAREVLLSANSAVHYDTSLLFDDENGLPVYEQLSWRPVTLP